MKKFFQRIANYFKNLEHIGFVTGEEAVSAVRTAEVRQAQIVVNFRIQEKLHGSEYAGEVGLGKRQFSFRFLLGVPIPQLIGMGQTSDMQEIRRLFQLKLMRDSEEVELSPEAYLLFVELLMNPVTRFYELGSVIGDDIGVPMRPGMTVVQMSKEMTASFPCAIPQPYLALLSSQQFGCEF